MSFRALLTLVLAFTLVSCGDNNPTEDRDGGADGGNEGAVPSPCDGVHCGDLGACRVVGGKAVCACSRGYTSVAQDCVYESEDLCARATCTAGCEATEEGDPRCLCSDGERSAGLTCVDADAPACASVACSGHGTCDESTGRCTCEDGYRVTGDGLGCVREAPTEVCRAGMSTLCAEGRSYQTCCTGWNCKYRFTDGTTFRGLSSAAAYCLGEDIAMEVDGNCSGVPDHCDTIADEQACLATAKCNWSNVCWANELERRCEGNRTPDRCAAMTGCAWSSVTDDDRDWRCGARTGLCEAGRDYQLCCDQGCEARFEDGTVLRGPESTVGYCFGQIDANQGDGTCIADCSLIKDQDRCENIGDYCHWAGGMCRGGYLQCFASYTQSTCNGHDACYWTTPDVEFREKDFHPGDAFDAETTALPTLSSPPFPFDTACPKECANACVGAGGAITINESGIPKPLGNMTFCLPNDTALLAMMDATVVRAEKLGEADYSLHLRPTENRNFLMVYDHIGAVTVDEGDVVSAGERVGTAVSSLGYAGFEVQINQMRGSDNFGDLTLCPVLYTTGEVTADFASRLLINHVHDPYWRGTTWTLCERPFVTAY